MVTLGRVIMVFINLCIYSGKFNFLGDKYTCVVGECIFFLGSIFGKGKSIVFGVFLILVGFYFVIYWLCKFGLVICCED